MKLMMIRNMIRRPRIPTGDHRSIIYGLGKFASSLRLPQRSLITSSGSGTMEFVVDRSERPAKDITANDVLF